MKKTFSALITTGTVSFSLSVIALLAALLLPILTLVLPDAISIQLFLPHVIVVLCTGILGLLVGALSHDLHLLNRIGMGTSMGALVSLCLILYA